MLTEADILLALRDCYDPDIPLNIVDLGLVESIAVTPDANAPGAGIPGVPTPHRVNVTVTPTSEDDTKQAQLSAQISNRLAGMEQVSRSSITFSTMLWTPQRISVEGRKALNLDSPFSILNNIR